MDFLGIDADRGTSGGKSEQLFGWRRCLFLSVYKQYGIWRVSVLALSDLGGKNVGRGVCVSCIPARARLLACGKCRDAGASADGGAALVRKGGRDWCTQ